MQPQFKAVILLQGFEAPAGLLNREDLAITGWMSRHVSSFNDAENRFSYYSRSVLTSTVSLGGKCHRDSFQSGL